MTNERLRAALAQAGMEIDDLADAVQVDAKTVRRWLSGGTPYSRHRTRVAKALGVGEHELWPDAQPPTPGTSRLELVGAFAHANDVLAPDWRPLLKNASERIELLDLTLLEIISQPGVTDLLAQKAAGGCRIRLLISTVDSTFLGVTEHELNPEYSPTQHPELGYEIQLARGHIEPLLGTAGIEVRKYLTMRFNTIIRCDEQMLVTLHLHGTPAREAPVIHLRQADHPGLFSQFEQHYQAIWENASDPVTPEPDLFPDPNTEPDHYQKRGALFDDTRSPSRCAPRIDCLSRSEPEFRTLASRSGLR